ncbi:hypothetical protein KEM55_008163 [Ascosphaera atra]|nr:hypothetical protein KEM55_008163 [Ascosphaera atra]
MPSENQIPPMQYPQYPQMGPMPMPPQPPYINHGASASGTSLGGSRPQSPTLGSAVGAPGPGAPAYGVTPRLRPPRQSSAQRASTGASRSSIYAGIEQLPLPQGVVPMDPAPSRISTYNPNASFDTILKEHPGGKKKKKWGVGSSG